MAERVTRCPHCKTSFRIRDEHLKAAGGSVRCGSCLAVFKALDNLVTSQQPPRQPQPSTSRPNTAEKPQPQEASTARLAATDSASALAASATANSSGDNTSMPGSLESQQEVDANELFDNLFGSEQEEGVTDDPFSMPDTPNSGDVASEFAPSGDWGEEVSDFGDLLDDSLLGGEEVDESPSLTQEPEEDDGLIHDSMDDEEEDDFLIHDDMDGEDEDDEMISDDPFADLGLREPDDLDRPKPLTGLEIDESLLDAVHAESEENMLPDPDEQSEDDEAWARALLEEDEPPEDITRELGLELEPEEPQEEERELQIDFGESDPAEQIAHSAAPAAAAVSSIRGTKSKVAFELADDDPLDEPEPPASSARTIEIPTRAMREIQPEPIKLETESTPESSADYMGWVGGSVVLLLLAALQLFYFNFDQWARTPQWRPAYATVCSVTGCKLPAVQDVRRIKARNLVVRSHPSVANALVVDTLMQNESAFPQPFPDLVLIFRDLNDNIVASRQFNPQEYLSGEMAGSTDMPSRTPVHIGIEILDPGQNAVSYAVQLAPNQ